MASSSALSTLLADDFKNAALRQILSTYLSVGELSTLVRVCAATRSWLVDYGAQLFLGVTGVDEVGEVKVLRPWRPHMLLNGQPAMCKKKTINITPRIYSCHGRTTDGKQLVREVPRGALADLERSGVSVLLVHASGEKGEAEMLLRNRPLFAKRKPSKGQTCPCYDTYHIGAHIHDTLSRHRTPPGLYRLRVVAHLAHLCEARVSYDYTYTSDAFYVVSAPPKKGSATEKARREQPHKRARLV